MRSNGLPRSLVQAVVFAICTSLLSACATVEHYTAVPPSEKHEATVLDLPNAPYSPIGRKDSLPSRNAPSFAKRRLSASAAGAPCQLPMCCRSLAVAIMEPSALDCWSVGRLMAVVRSLSS